MVSAARRSSWWSWAVPLVPAILMACGHGSGSTDVAPVAGSGVLVMAHGGSSEWNVTVEEAVAPLRALAPTVVAFGMAERQSLQAAVDSLERMGVSHIAVVRLFISGESFLERTEHLFGLRSAGEEPANGDPERPIERRAAVALSQEGLADAVEMGGVLAQRVGTLSVEPRTESVLVIAHGMGDDSVNADLVRRIDMLARAVRESAPYRSVLVETLREDWAAKRVEAEQRIRAHVQAGSADGGRVIVVPFRLAGFGPYREVLDGHDYMADGVGLIPHPLVTDWMARQASELFARAGWPNPFGGR